MKKGKRVGVYICHCGRNIAGYVNVEQLVEKVQGLKGVVTVRHEKYMCSEQGQQLIKEDIKQGLVDRVVVASCTPTMHEKTFRKCVSEAGLNPFLYQQVNIRENCSWVTEDIQEATEKAFELIKAGVWRVRFLEPLEPLEYPLIPSTLVIGGGIAGVITALDISEAGFKVVVVEKEDKLGGWGNKIGFSFPHLVPVKDFLRERIEELLSRPNVKVYLKGEVEQVEGFSGNFTVKIRTQEGVFEERIGSIVVATGFMPFDAKKKAEYGYGRFPQVLTTVELEERFLNGWSDPIGPKAVAFVQCVGSRDQSIGRPYCSRACCTVVAKQALLLKKLFPKVKVYVFYMDVRTFGKGYEELFEEAQREGVIYLRANPGEVYPAGDHLVVRYEDTLLGRPAELKVDLLVLAVGMEPPEGSKDLMKKLYLNADADGFFLESHSKLGPVDTFSEGVFLAGCCQGPKDILDTISQAHAAAARATRLFHVGKVIKEPIVVEVDQDVCSQCRICEATCNFNAVVYDPKAKRMKVIEAACKGCGACAASCPSGAMSLKHFRYRQVLLPVEALLH